MMKRGKFRGQKKGSYMFSSKYYVSSSINRISRNQTSQNRSSSELQKTSLDSNQIGNSNDSGYIKIHHRGKRRDSHSRKEYRPLVAQLSSKQTVVEEFTMANLGGPALSSQNEGYLPSSNYNRANNHKSHEWFQSRGIRDREDSMSSPGKYMTKGRASSPPFEDFKIDINGRTTGDFFNKAQMKKKSTHGFWKPNHFIAKSSHNQPMVNNFFNFAKKSRPQRNSKLTDNSNTKFSLGSYGSSKYSKTSFMMPVDIECLSEKQLLQLKNKIDSKLTAKSYSRMDYPINTRSSQMKSRELGEFYKKKSKNNNQQGKSAKELNREEGLLRANTSMSFKKDNKAMSLQNKKKNPTSKERKSREKSREKMKKEFKLSFERPNLPVATGMSEQLIYRPQNLDLIANQLAVLNQTDNEADTSRFGSIQTEESINV